jgi:hypothetical protein
LRDIEQRRGETHLRRLPLDQFEQFADIFEVADVLEPFSTAMTVFP